MTMGYGAEESTIAGGREDKNWSQGVEGFHVWLDSEPGAQTSRNEGGKLMTWGWEDDCFKES